MRFFAHTESDVRAMLDMIGARGLDDLIAHVPANLRAGAAIVNEFNHGFTSNGGSNSVTMFDLRTSKSLMVIRYTGIKPDAIEYDPDSRRVFVVNGAATGDVTVIAPDTGAIVGTVALKGGKLTWGQEGRARNKWSGPTSSAR